MQTNTLRFRPVSPFHRAAITAVMEGLRQQPEEA